MVSLVLLPMVLRWRILLFGYSAIGPFCALRHFADIVEVLLMLLKLSDILEIDVLELSNVLELSDALELSDVLETDVLKNPHIKQAHFLQILKFHQAFHQKEDWNRSALFFSKSSSCVGWLLDGSDRRRE